MKRTYTGGCHCGAVRYEVDVDLSQGTLKCNCSVCRKGRAWLAGVDAASFRLLQGEDALSEYQFNRKQIRHLFCRHCGVKSFSRGKGSGGKDLVAIMINCLDELEDGELAALPVTYVDGRNDDFKSVPRETRHL
jgi:hypothetical protein